MQSLGALVFLWVMALSTLTFAQDESEHASHHPDEAKDSAGPPGPGQAGPPSGAGPGMMGGGMMGPGGMGKMMEKMGAPKEKELYPDLMSLPNLPLEKRAAIQDKAHQRMKDGVASISKGMTALTNAAPTNDFAAMQQATGHLREGLAVFESGLAAHRAIAEGKAPQNVALQWFRQEMNLASGAVVPAHTGILGLSWSHLTLMLMLIGFAATMLWMYFFKMRRASELLAALTVSGASANTNSVPGAGAALLREGSTTGSPEPAPAPLDTNVPLSSAVPVMAPAKKWSGSLRVARIFDECPGVKTFRFVQEDGGAIPFTYLPGQFLTISVSIEGKTMKRSYTIASTPSQRHYCELTIKREDQGVVSRFLHDNIKVGDAIGVAGPLGKFVFTGTESHEIVLIAGGVGITPAMSVIRYLTDSGWDGQIHLLYCCRTTRDFIFREELEYLQKRHENLHVVATMTRADGTVWMGTKGRFTAELVHESVPDIASKRVHMCGPPAMMEALNAMLQKLGVPDEAIKTEAFGPAKKPSAPPASPSDAVDATGTAVSVEFQASGKTALLSPEATVLDAADQVGVEIENSCRAGSCGSCKVKLLSGEVTMECEDSLEPDEKADGFILACQAKSTDNVVIDA